MGPDLLENFSSAAKSALAFLGDEYDFELHEMVGPAELSHAHALFKATFWRAQPSQPDFQFVSLMEAPARLERDLIFGYAWPRERSTSINLRELLPIEAPDLDSEFLYDGVGSLADLAQITEAYSILGEALRSHGTRFFNRDSTLMAAVQVRREQRRLALHNEETSRRAEMAFKASDWTRAIELLESLGDHKTKLQSARLKYARKRVTT